jgi:YcxB-like protein
MVCAVELSWQPELADFTDAFRARNRTRQAWLKIGVICGASLVVGVVLFITGAAPEMAPLFCFVAVLGLLAALVMQPISVRSFWRRNAALRAPLHVRVDPVTGITLTGQSTATHPWPVVHSFLETDRVFVVQISGYRRLGFLLLAKRGLPDERQVDDLRNRLSAGIASAARVAP